MTAAAFLELVRAPAALTVLGDTVAGAGNRPLAGRRLLLPLASVAFYTSGMALNDWADRKLDARERADRPIPSGRIRPGTALATAIGLTGTGLGIAALAGGRPALVRAAPLAAAVWAYDTMLKSTPAGPLAMAACRALDVLMGAGPAATRAAGPAAAAIAGHTLGLTLLSRGEVHGGTAATARLAVAGTLAATGLACAGRARSPRHRLAGAAAALGFLGLTARRQLAAARQPDPATVRAATVAGIHGMLPLQSAIAARTGSFGSAGLLALGLPVAGRLARRVSPS
ncbi:MAG: SCO3242 family prenyltransferase [Jatrophihabitantaceae bacterium]